MTLTELLLLIIVIAGAAYAGYIFGRWSILNEQAGGTPSRTDSDSSPLPGPRETLDPPRRASPPPATAGGTHADVPAGGSRTGPEPRRTAAPPPARAGLMDTGSGNRPAKK